MTENGDGRAKPNALFQHVWALVLAFFGAFFFKDRATDALSRAFPSAGWTYLAGFLLPAALGASAGIALKGFLSTRRTRAKITHPEEPWLWTEEWAEGRIAHSNLGAAIGIAIMALVTDLFAYAVAVITFQKFSLGLLFVLLLFGLAALAVSGIAIAIVRQHIAFGRSTLLLETRPGVVGKEFAGAVELRLPDADSKQEFRVTLSCSKTNRKNSVWEKDLVVAREALRQRGERVEVPFRFEIPRDLPGTESEAASTGASWQLAVAAATPRGSYSSKFAVPVFRTFRSPAVDAEPPRPAELPAVGRKTGGRRAVVLAFAALGLLLLSVFPLFGVVVGGYLLNGWRTAGREDLGRVGRHAMTERRDCQFFYTGSIRTRRFADRSFYVYPVGEKAYACSADNGFTEREDKSGTCPCMSLREAEENKISAYRCEEHVDVLFDPAHPTECRPAARIGQRSDSEKESLLLGFLCIVGGGAGVAHVVRVSLRR